MCHHTFQNVTTADATAHPMVPDTFGIERASRFSVGRTLRRDRDQWKLACNYAKDTRGARVRRDAKLSRGQRTFRDNR